MADREQPDGTLGEYLRGLRTQRGMRLKDVSKASGIALARLEALETGLGTPNRREVRLLARAFHISLETMMVKAGQLRLILD